MYLKYVIIAIILPYEYGFLSETWLRHVLRM